LKSDREQQAKQKAIYVSNRQSNLAGNQVKVNSSFYLFRYFRNKIKTFSFAVVTSGGRKPLAIKTNTM
jgi:hypothetical protein